MHLQDVKKVLLLEDKYRQAKQVLDIMLAMKEKEVFVTIVQPYGHLLGSASIKVIDEKYFDMIVAEAQKRVDKIADELRTLGVLV